MTRLQKTIGLPAIVFAIAGAVIIYASSPHGSTAATASMAVTISPEEMTGSIVSMSVLPMDKSHDMSFVYSDRD